MCNLLFCATNACICSIQRCCSSIQKMPDLGFVTNHSDLQFPVECHITCCCSTFQTAVDCMQSCMLLLDVAHQVLLFRYVTRKSSCLCGSPPVCLSSGNLSCYIQGLTRSQQGQIACSSMGLPQGLSRPQQGQMPFDSMGLPQGLSGPQQDQMPCSSMGLPQGLLRPQQGQMPLSSMALPSGPLSSQQEQVPQAWGSMRLPGPNVPSQHAGYGISYFQLSRLTSASQVLTLHCLHQ